MKAIIIAAGAGIRLSPFTNDLPKCMLQFGSKTLLQHQLEVFQKCNIRDIALIKGYKKKKINYPGIKYYINDNYRNNNILNSLFYAEKEIIGNLIISYSDIFFKKRIVNNLLASKKDISIIVDIDWKKNYKGRKYHPQEEAEKVVLDNNKILEIGKILTEKYDVHGEFIGMMKLTPRGSQLFRKHFNRAKKLFWGKPYQKAPVFEKAYLTDMIQDMVDAGIAVHCVNIKGGWKEIDTIEDYKKALNEIK